MHLMRGFNGGLMPEGSDRIEGIPYHLGAFLAVALDWRAQARNAASNTQALQALKEEVAALKEEKEALGRQNEAYQASLKLAQEAQEAKEEADRQLNEAMEIQADRPPRHGRGFRRASEGLGGSMLWASGETGEDGRGNGYQGQGLGPSPGRS